MTGIQVEITGGKTKFLPGDELQGVVQWEFAKAPKSVVVRLFWRTEGKGTADTKVVQQERFDAPAQSDRKTFRIPIPQGPYSFSGKLISLLWAVQAVAEPGSKSERIDLTLSPTGDEILLHRKK